MSASASGGERDAAVAEAAAALETVRSDLMACPGVCGTYVGFMRDVDGALTETVGIVLIVDPATSPGDERSLPSQVAGVTVQVVHGTPAPGA